MPTVEQRLGQWQQELLDLTNRNRLLSFRPSTTRPSTLQLVAPHASEIYRALLDGKSLLIEGNDEFFEIVDPDEHEDALAVPDIDTADNGPPTPSGEIIEPTASPTSPGPLLEIKPGTARSNMPLDRTNRVALRLLTRARSSEQEQGINTFFAVVGLLKWQEKPGEETWRYAPLVMLPLKIEENAREGRYRIAASGDDPEFNQTLGERLRRDCPAAGSGTPAAPTATGVPPVPVNAASDANDRGATVHSSGSTGPIGTGLPTGLATGVPPTGVPCWADWLRAPAPSSNAKPTTVRIAGRRRSICFPRLADSTGSPHPRRTILPHPGCSHGKAVPSPTDGLSFRANLPFIR